MHLMMFHSLDLISNSNLIQTEYNKTRGKSLCKTWFHVGMELKKYRNKAEMKERKKTTLHLQKYTADVG